MNSGAAQVLKITISLNLYHAGISLMLGPLHNVKSCQSLVALVSFHPQNVIFYQDN